jgi:biopolymer transport protein ExbD
MSHGGGGSNCPIVEPNLTPLLDVVLQLLMFFMMCVNFVTEQVNKDIKLPVSESAKAVDKADADALFLNQKSMKSKEFRNSLSPATLERLGDAESVVMVPGKEPMRLIEAKAWLKQQAEDAKKTSKDGKIHTVIHFRPDADLELNQLFTLMQHCKVVGYKQLKIRAITKNVANRG